MTVYNRLSINLSNKKVFEQAKEQHETALLENGCRNIKHLSNGNKRLNLKEGEQGTAILFGLDPLLIRLYL